MIERHDVVIIGAGHNGLAAAAEIARAGLSVAVLEAGATVGGCASTTEPLLPGFRHSPHANTLIFSDIMPRRIAPDTLGLSLHHPEAQLGVAFADGRPPVMLHRPDLLARTQASLGAYSRKDASTYVAIKRRSSPFGPIIRDGLYKSPDRGWFAAQRDAVRAAYKGIVDVRSLGAGTARALIDRLFETPEIRVLLYHLAIETGLALEEEGGDIAFLGYSLWIAGRWRIVAGGMGAYSDALARAATGAGAKLYCSTPAARIVSEQGRATAVDVANGRFCATRAVLAAVPILGAFDTLIDAGVVGAVERAEIDALRRQRPTTVATSFFCLERAPRYKSARHDAEIDLCLKTVIGHETPADVLRLEEDLRRGLLPRASGTVRSHSLWDPSLAPVGRHSAAVDSRFPASHWLERGDWDQIEQAYCDAFHATWAGYCEPESLSSHAMKSDFGSPFERRMLVRMGVGQYRSSVAGLYFAGPGLYPGGGVHGACGLNAAGVILGDDRKQGKARSVVAAG